MQTLSPHIPVPPAATEFKRLAVCELDHLNQCACFVTRDTQRAASLVEGVYARALGPASIEAFAAQGAGMRAWLMTIFWSVLHEPPRHNGKGAGGADAFKRDQAAQESINHGKTPPPVPPDSPDPSEIVGVDWASAEPRLSAGLDSMSGELREVLWLWAVERLTCREIGAALAVPIETAMGRLHQARSQVGRLVLGDRLRPTPVPTRHQ